ncbi:hypothetical protein F4823DRAFT_565699 [Ustulina deusta]|nr:hypothetical protein F4823DRAFT_565699 [Ustulina deusta]
MAPPTNAELARREAAVRRALEDLDPDGLTPAVLRDLIIEVGARHTVTGGAIMQAAMGVEHRGQGGRGGGQGRGGGGGGSQGTGIGHGTGAGQAGAGHGTGAGDGGAGAGDNQGSSGQQ